MDATTGDPRLQSSEAGRALAILALVNLAGALDRVVVASLVESLRADLWLTDFRLGWLMSGFALAYLAAGRATAGVDARGRRPRLLAGAVALAAVGTMLCGAARGFVTLLAARAAAAAGVAAGVTLSSGFLPPDASPAHAARIRRALVAAVPIGSALGYAVGGVAGWTLGWRAAFVVAGGPGLVLALLCLRMAGPRAHRRDPPPAPPSPADPLPADAHAGEAHARSAERAPLGEGLRGAWRRLAADPAYRAAFLGHAACTFALAAMAFWTPAFLERARGVPRPVAAVEYAVVVVMAGLAGTWAGALLARALRRRLRRPEPWVAGVAALAAAPLALVAFTAHRPSLYLPALVLAHLLLFASTGPAAAALGDAVRHRPGALSGSLLAVHLLGDVPSAAVVGAVSDLTSLQRGMLAVPAALVAGAVAFALAARRSERAARQAPSASP